MNKKQYAWFAAWSIAAAVLTIPSMGLANLCGVAVGLYLLAQFWSHPRWKRGPVRPGR